MNGLKELFVRRFLNSPLFYIVATAYIVIDQTIKWSVTRETLLYPTFAILNTMLEKETCFFYLKVSGDPLSFVLSWGQIDGFSTEDYDFDLADFITDSTKKEFVDNFLKKDIKNPYYQKACYFLYFYIKLQQTRLFLEYCRDAIRNLFLFSVLFL